jgi:hypothetical protein
LASPKEPGMQKEPNRYGICDNMGKMREIAMTGMEKKTNTGQQKKRVQKYLLQEVSDNGMTTTAINKDRTMTTKDRMI